MDRLSLSQSDVDRHRAEKQAQYPSATKPCPGTVLKLDDDIEIYNFIRGRVVWGHDDPAQFHLFAPDVFGDYAPPLEVGYVNDRAPADSSESPLPIYTQQQLAQQPGARDAGRKKPTEADIKQSLHALAKSLPPEPAKRLRDYVSRTRPELKLPAEEG